MVSPVPGLGSPSLHPSSLFFGYDLCDFLVVQVNAIVVVGVIVVAWWVSRRRRRGGGAFGAVARATTALFYTFYVRHREMAAVLVGVLEGA